MATSKDRIALSGEIIRLAEQTRDLIEAAVNSGFGKDETERDYLLSGACFLPHIARENSLAAVKEALALTKRTDIQLHGRWVALADKVAKAYGLGSFMTLKRAA